MAAEVGQVSTVVVVDDDETVRRLMVYILSGLNYATIEFASARHALTYVERMRPVDLVVTDINPNARMTGWQLTRRIHAIHPRLPILIVSGAPGAYFGEPYTSLLHKPFRVADFISAVRQYLPDVERDMRLPRNQS